MAVPTFDQFIEPLLRYLAEHPAGSATSAAYTVLAERLALTTNDLAELLPRGVQAVYKNRISWAHDRLKRAGISSSPTRGTWRLTDQGRAFAASHRTLAADDLDQLIRVDRDSTVAGALRPMSPPSASPATTTSPEERIDAALAELHDSVARDLLEIVGNTEPEFFEQLVLDLLHTMGYGTSRADLQRVGRAGDGGIDGIISLDKLGIEKVYVQAKRWRGDVDSPTIRDFLGALQVQGAAKGVVITTSSFTRPAREAADRARGSIVLVDGRRLATLMIDHGVGITHKPLKVPKIDSDYFEDD